MDPGSTATSFFAPSEAPPATAPSQDLGKSVGFDDYNPPDALDDAVQAQLQETRDTLTTAPARLGAKKLKAGSHEHIKKSTNFSGLTNDGVLKRTTFMATLSTFRTSPQTSIASRDGSSFIRSQQGPSPGTYNNVDMEKTKFKRVGSFSFGGSIRFGQGHGGGQPGPGNYHPRDPSLYCDTKVGFGTSVRNKITGTSHMAPGPGAYEPFSASARSTPAHDFGSPRPRWFEDTERHTPAAAYQGGLDTATPEIFGWDAEELCIEPY